MPGKPLESVHAASLSKDYVKHLRSVHFTLIGALQDLLDPLPRNWLALCNRAKQIDQDGAQSSHQEGTARLVRAPHRRQVSRFYEARVGIFWRGEAAAAEKSLE
jgi:hypothetical protein